MADAEQVRAWCLAMPGAHEEETWGHATFRVRRKLFAILREDAPEGATVTLKAVPTDQAELVATAPGTWSVASHVGRFGWVTARLAGADDGELRSVLCEAWRRTAPRAEQAELSEELRALLPAPR